MLIIYWCPARSIGKSPKASCKV